MKLRAAGSAFALLAAAAAGAAAQGVSVPPRPLAMANGIQFNGPSTATASNARSLFVMHCAGCHGMDGSGHPAQGVPDMRGALGHFLRLDAGRAFLVQVPGVNNAGLDDAQVAALANWMLPRFSAATVPPGWAPYTAAEVAALRRERPVDVAGARAAIVERLRAEGHALY